VHLWRERASRGSEGELARAETEEARCAPREVSPLEERSGSAPARSPLASGLSSRTNTASGRDLAARGRIRAVPDQPGAGRASSTKGRVLRRAGRAVRENGPVHRSGRRRVIPLTEPPAAIVRRRGE
jgi:hypothetical protein